MQVKFLLNESFCFLEKLGTQKLHLHHIILLNQREYVL